MPCGFDRLSVCRTSKARLIGGLFSRFRLSPIRLRNNDYDAFCNVLTSFTGLLRWTWLST